MGERQREWPHEAQTRFALVVHALPAPAVPRRSQRRVLPWEGVNATGSPATPPLTREWARSARLCIRQHPAAHIVARVGKSGAVASPNVGETGIDRP